MPLRLDRKICDETKSSTNNKYLSRRIKESIDKTTLGNMLSHVGPGVVFREIVPPPQQPIGNQGYHDKARCHFRDDGWHGQEGEGQKLCQRHKA